MEHGSTSDEQNANFRSQQQHHSQQRSNKPSKSLPNLGSLSPGTQLIIDHSLQSSPEQQVGITEQVPPNCTNTINTTPTIDLTPAEPEPPARVWSPSTIRYWTLQYTEDNIKRSPIDEEGMTEPATPASQLGIHKNSAVVPSYVEVHRKYLADFADPPPPPGLPNKKRPGRILDRIILRAPGRRRVHYVDGRLLQPPSRTMFIYKVMSIKLIKWFVATASTMCSLYIPHLREFAREYAWSASIPTFLYLFMFTLVRSFPGLLRPAFCIFVLVFNTVCLTTVGCVIYCAFATPLIPTFMITMTLFYGCTAALSRTAEVDPTRDSVVPAVLLFDMVFSLLAFTVSHELLIGNEAVKLGQQVGSIWFPAAMLSQAMTLMEMAEMKAIVDGLRIDVSPNDWIAVAAFLF